MSDSDHQNTAGGGSRVKVISETSWRLALSAGEAAMSDRPKNLLSVNDPFAQATAETIYNFMGSQCEMFESMYVAIEKSGRSDDLVGYDLAKLSGKLSAMGEAMKFVRTVFKND